MSSCNQKRNSGGRNSKPVETELQESYTPESSNAAGIKDIALAAGVSIGTVDRALHGRPGINPKTLEHVRKTAETMGYRPNIAARNLKLNQRHRIAALLPSHIAWYFDAIADAITDAAQHAQIPVHLVIRRYPELWCGGQEALEEILQEPWDGLIVVPTPSDSMSHLISEAIRKGIAVICVATDSPSGERMSVISPAARVSGAVAAELLFRMHAVERPLMVTGDLHIIDHFEKIEGFREKLTSLDKNSGAPITLETHDQWNEAYQQTREFIIANPDISGLYISTSNALPVIAAMKETGKYGQIPLITTDLFPELVPHIRSGVITATLSQQPQLQGRTAFEFVYRYLTGGIAPLDSYPIMPRIVMSANIDMTLAMEGAGRAR